MQIIGETIAEIWKNTVLPFLSWLVEDALPGVLDFLTGIFEYLARNPDTLKALTELVIQFVAAWKLAEVIANLAKLANAFNPIQFAIMSVITAIILLVANFNKLEGIDRVGAVIGAVTLALGALAVLIFSIQGGIAGIAVGVLGIVAGLAAITTAIGSTMKTSYGSSGKRAVSGYSAELSSIPHLASGAVISPNSEFLAVLGDQRSGTNIETPLATMKQAFMEAISEMGGVGGETAVNITFDGSLAQLARILEPKISVESARKGPSLVSGGVF